MRVKKRLGSVRLVSKIDDVAWKSFIRSSSQIEFIASKWPRR